MPPEIINNSLKCGTYSDLWSLGCIIYDMVYGTPPFKDKTEYLVFENIMNLKYSFPPEKPISEDIKDIIEKLLKVNPQERMSGDGNLLELKNHPFFSNFNPKTIQEDLRCKFKPAKPKKYSTANQILTSNFHENSIVSNKSKVRNSCKIKKDYKSPDLNYWEDTYDDEEIDTNFNSSNNNSNINGNNVNTNLNLNNNVKGNSNLNNFSLNSNPLKNENCHQNYISGLKVKNINKNFANKNSKNFKNYKTEKKAQRESNLEALVDYSNSDFDEQDYIEDITKEELDEHKEVFVPSHNFDVRIPKNNSVKNLGLKFVLINFDMEIQKSQKYV